MNIFSAAPENAKKLERSIPILHCQIFRFFDQYISLSRTDLQSMGTGFQEKAHGNAVCRCIDLPMCRCCGKPDSPVFAPVHHQFFGKNAGRIFIGNPQELFCILPSIRNVQSHKLSSGCIELSETSACNQRLLYAYKEKFINSAGASRAF